MNLNFTSLSETSVLGRTARAMLRLLPKGQAVPILQGKAKGKLWIVGTGTHGCWLGSYELRKRLAFEKHVGEGDVVYDIGANAGYFTVLAAVLVGSSGKVVAFEPLPDNAAIVQAHSDLNKFHNVVVIPAAVANYSGGATFSVGVTDAVGRLDTKGDIEVEVVCLDQFVEKRKLPLPTLMKIDVEGAESQVLEGARDVLVRSGCTLFIDTHGTEVHIKCIRFLEDLGYRLEFPDGKSPLESSEIYAFAPKA